MRKRRRRRRGRNSASTCGRAQLLLHALNRPVAHTGEVADQQQLARDVERLGRCNERLGVGGHALAELDEHVETAGNVLHVGPVELSMREVEVVEGGQQQVGLMEVDAFHVNRCS